MYFNMHYIFILYSSNLKSIAFNSILSKLILFRKVGHLRHVQYQDIVLTIPRISELTHHLL